MKNLSIIANWKLNGNKNTITNSLINLTTQLTNIPQYIKIAIAPPILYIDMVKNHLTSYNNKTIELCSQNVDIHLSGAFTGDISASMLKDLSVKYVLIGHSERRIYHKENNSLIAQKFSIIKQTELIPILCIGENKEERDSGSTQSICIQQIDSIIKLVGIKAFENTIIAYEPVWAIGSGSSASPRNVQSIHQFIRNYIAQYDKTIANQISIQYGGSITTDNVLEFITQKDIDGVLVGSASLDIRNLIKIINLSSNLIKKTYQ
ncbi:triosephosphate isomerase [Candidatus Blochmanniella floridana]|uniref:Triosephosphate isomerase n=1 Tax=Blochmanniella floridana TaxID=203907 RepID=TPIS_BLOFL|nr:RecName: Full=Triosephosphate isomerase; Short=TIM; Short=TPI; AltName: Full=Triose-phosphate isomerase [Candidatus Blochmannia floridanus]CAD83276.1 triosephosphate isomerase [Candidatus Blochmannia floridanus]